MVGIKEWLHPLFFWTKEELKTFLTLAEDHMGYQSFIFFYTDFYTGMRKGELIALEWKDIDFNKNSIIINKTMFFRDGKEILQSPKKFKSKRTIAINDKTSKLLRKWRSKQKETLLANGITTEPLNVFIRHDIRTGDLPIQMMYWTVLSKYTTCIESQFMKFAIRTHHSFLKLEQLSKKFKHD
ncbi:hypothetical protein J6TS2_42360 [Heyndrickxia sporothermodurans]|nr:hypothetical protein J6TS2_42360 [Heyndrickxia sporothermodurans]